jgi:hypothetical protein
MSNINIKSFINGLPYNKRGDSVIDFSSVGCQTSYPLDDPSVKTFVVTTDNFNKLQEVLDDTSYGKIVFSKGTFRFSTPIVIRRSNLVVEGTLSTSNRRISKLIFDDTVGIEIQGLM